MDARASLDMLPGFRRRLIVAPSASSVSCDLEDDYHRMSVTVHHDGAVASSVVANMIRAPWTTCPGAQAMLVRRFSGVALDEFPSRGEKVLHCTHLYDLALLAAAHAHDRAPVVFDILVSDPVDGIWRAELRRGGHAVLGWEVADLVLAAPPALAGLHLNKLRPWIDLLDPAAQEDARLLRWGTMLAHGRARRHADPAEPRLLPIGQCFTFQPEMAPHATYVDGSFRDFSAAAVGPLGS